MAWFKSVMFATNQMTLIVARAFALAAAVVRLVPKPAPTIDPARSGAH